eukprot:TRINITY_DN16466_c0_g1_i1.p1 TRINITY_DN16466_c0_g1~~TRINITY_DN16466_c0_g1_i1.p1  ORF type:complete len:210 (-),score=36.11 TRINITY_DN16466_c0_g1_i1:23-652(-)
MMMSTRGEATAAIERLSLGDEFARFSENIALFCVVAVVVDVFVLFAAFPAQGAVREYIFGRRHGGFLLFVQCLAGPCVLMLLGVLLLVTFLLLFAGVFMSVPVATILAVTHGSCLAGGAAKEGIAQALAVQSALTVQRSVAAVNAICKDDHEAIATAAGIFTSGLVLAAFGQGWLIAAHTNTYDMVVSQEDLSDDDDLVKQRKTVSMHH